MGNNTGGTNEIKKLKIKETILFAMNNIPEADPTTLEQFLELVNAGGTFGAISHEQILKKMHQLLKYIPGACTHSLLIIADLLEIGLSKQLFLSSQSNWTGTDGASSTIAFLVEAPQAMRSQGDQIYSR
jgi:hypothetical protein